MNNLVVNLIKRYADELGATKVALICAIESARRTIAKGETNFTAISRAKSILKRSVEQERAKH